eukprot:scaffold2947_cov67-Phaeocystis_antarctica.AAC.4
MLARTWCWRGHQLSRGAAWRAATAAARAVAVATAAAPKTLAPRSGSRVTPRRIRRPRCCRPHYRRCFRAAKFRNRRAKCCSRLDDPEGTRGRVGHANLAFGHRSHRRRPCAGDSPSTKRRADSSERACVRAGPEVAVIVPLAAVITHQAVLAANVIGLAFGPVGIRQRRVGRAPHPRALGRGIGAANPHFIASRSSDQQRILRCGLHAR